MKTTSFLYVNHEKKIVWQDRKFDALKIVEGLSLRAVLLKHQKTIKTLCQFQTP